ncbi:MAG: hypothetical protein AAFN79_21620 [Pseudomonadota bacterium]
MLHLALLTGAIALWCLYEVWAAQGGGSYGVAFLGGVFAGLTWVCFDVDRHRRVDRPPPFEVYLGRWMLLIFASVGGPWLLLSFNDPELAPLGIFVGAFALFGVVFRFGFGRIPKTATPEGRKAQREESRRRKLTGKLNWSAEGIEDIMAETRMSPWPARGLLAFGFPLTATAAWGLSLAAFAGLAMVAAGLFLMALRAKSAPHGRNVLIPNDAPFRLKNGIGGGLKMSRPPKGEVNVSLTCVRRTLKVKADDTRTVEVETLWERSIPLSDGAFAFLPPPSMPPSQADGPEQVAWTLTASGDGFRAIFRLPVET